MSDLILDDSQAIKQGPVRPSKTANYGNSSLVADCKPAPDAFVTYTLETDEPMQIGASWLEYKKRPTAAKYIASDGQTFVADQTQDPRGMSSGGMNFQRLGVVRPVDGKITVTVPNEGPTGTVIFYDAILFRPIGVPEPAPAPPPPPPPEATPPEFVFPDLLKQLSQGNNECGVFANELAKSYCLRALGDADHLLNPKLKIGIAWGGVSGSSPHRFQGSCPRHLLPYDKGASPTRTLKSLTREVLVRSAMNRGEGNRRFEQKKFIGGEGWVLDLEANWTLAREVLERGVPIVTDLGNHGVCVVGFRQKRDGSRYLLAQDSARVGTGGVGLREIAMSKVPMLVENYHRGLHTREDAEAFVSGWWSNLDDRQRALMPKVS